MRKLEPAKPPPCVEAPKHWDPQDMACRCWMGSNNEYSRLFWGEVFVRDGKNIGIYVEISKVKKNQSLFFLEDFRRHAFWEHSWLLPFGHFQCDFCAAMRMDLSLCSKPITFGSNTIQCNDRPPTSNSWNFTIHSVKYTTGFKTTRFIGSPKQNSRVSVSKKTPTAVRWPKSFHVCPKGLSLNMILDTSVSGIGGGFTCKKNGLAGGWFFHEDGKMVWSDLHRFIICPVAW